MCPTPIFISENKYKSIFSKSIWFGKAIRINKKYCLTVHYTPISSRFIDKTRSSISRASMFIINSVLSSASSTGTSTKCISLFPTSLNVVYFKWTILNNFKFPFKKVYFLNSCILLFLLRSSKYVLNNSIFQSL